MPQEAPVPLVVLFRGRCLVSEWPAPAWGTSASHNPSRGWGSHKTVKLGPAAGITLVGSLIFLTLLLLSVLPALLCDSTTQPFWGLQLSCLLHICMAKHLYMVCIWSGAQVL